MPTRSLRLLGAGLCLLLGCANSGSSSPPAKKDVSSATEARHDVVIQFSDTAVEPATARVEHGGSVAWTSVTTIYYGVVSFPASIVSHFTCKELRPDFVVDGDRLVSLPLGASGENLTLPCPLQPGTYTYRIELSQAGSGGGLVGRQEDPMVSFTATLVVE